LSIESRVPAARLLSIGEAFEDLIFVGLERLPRLGEEVRTREFSATIGGGAVITAVAAARLGVDVTLASGLSAAGEARLRAERIRVINLRKRGEPHAVTAALSAGAERAFVTFDGVNARLEPRMAGVLRGTRATHVHLAFYPRNTAAWKRRALELRKKGIDTSCDFGWNDELARDPGLTDLLDAMNIVFVNEREAALYAGAADLPASLPFWEGRRSIVVIKLGADGSRAIVNGVSCMVPAPRVNAVDTTGAGDAFNGGFLSGWLRGASVVQCLKMGNRIGAASTRKPGGIEALPPRRRSGRTPRLRKPNGSKGQK
jgi:sugar/nucleoside kinase (ribokinase family)